MVPGNWEGVPGCLPPPILSPSLQLGSSGCFSRVVPLPIVPSPTLHMYLRLQLSSVRSKRCLQFWNPQVLGSKQDLEDRHESRNLRDLLALNIVQEPKIEKSLIFRLESLEIILTSCFT